VFPATSTTEVAMAGARVVRLEFETVTVREALEAFLTERDLAPGSRRKYRATLETMVAEVARVAL
jgi:hypothetical protein